VSPRKFGTFLLTGRADNFLFIRKSNPIWLASYSIALNYSLIIAKYHIFTSSIRVGSLDFDGFLLRLKDKLCILRTLAVKNKELDQFKETWAALL